MSDLYSQNIKGAFLRSHALKSSILLPSLEDRMFQTTFIVLTASPHFLHFISACSKMSTPKKYFNGSLCNYWYQTIFAFLKRNRVLWTQADCLETRVSAWYLEELNTSHGLVGNKGRSWSGKKSIESREGPGGTNNRLADRCACVWGGGL